MITLNASELSLILGGDALDDYLNNPYMYPLGGGWPGVNYPPMMPPSFPPNFY